MTNRIIFILLFQILSFYPCFSQEKTPVLTNYNDIITGAQVLLNSRMDLIEGKNIAVVANHASLIGKTHLVDTLVSLQINIVRIFSPEHGFRGDAEAGEMISGETDVKTGIKIISLYGKYRKPLKDDLANIDLVLFDLQDVGVRFFTYTSTMSYLMEACAENNIPVVILDRPNPNGFYIDGPILDSNFSSFVGLHPVPIAYGMTIGEYAQMINGEFWLADSMQCDLTVIPMKNYKHNMIVKLPAPPSPNLPTWQSVYLYPSLCLFEGTVMSVGRGTGFPFQIYGHPEFMIGSFAFTPQSMPGKSLHPKFEGQLCYGQNLTGYADNYKYNAARLNLTWLIESYKLINKGSDFFTAYFDKLAGTDKLRKQIEEGKTEAEIRKSWENGLDQFRKTRSNYLIYN
jgi:uncharacterized protein YbbC (DUF1343 family)